MAGIDFDLDLNLDPQAWASRWRDLGRVWIPSILQTAGAAALHRCLAEQVGWGLTVGPTGSERMCLSAAQWEAVDGAQRRNTYALATQSGGLEGAHLFESCMPQGTDSASGPPLLAIFEQFLNSVDFLEFLRALTGRRDIRSITTAAACYRPGHFYAFHQDVPRAGQQLGSLVFNVPQRWLPQWGGLLLFRDESTTLLEAFVPAFNSLSLFRADCWHAVTAVAPFAAEPRYTVGGRIFVNDQT